MIALSFSVSQGNPIPNPLYSNYGNMSVYMDGAYPVINMQGDFYSCDLSLFLQLPTSQWVRVSAMPNINFQNKEFKHGRNTTIQLLNDVRLRYEWSCDAPITEYGTGIYIIKENETSSDCYENPLGDCNSTDPKFNFDQVCELYEFGEYIGDQQNYVCTLDDYILNNTDCPLTFNPDCTFTQSELNHTLEVEFTISNSSPFLVIDPTVTFSNNDIEGIAMDTIDNDEYIIAWCDETQDDVTFATYFTNGTLRAGPTDIDAAVGSCPLVADYLLDVIVLDTTLTKAAVIYRGSAGTALTRVFNYRGFGFGTSKTATSSKVNAVTLTKINDSFYIGAWIDSSQQDATMALFDVNANNATGHVDIDTVVGKTTASIDSTSFLDGSNNFTIIYTNDASNSIRLASYKVNFTIPITLSSLTGGGIAIDTGHTTGYGAVSIDSYNSREMAVAWLLNSGSASFVKYSTYYHNQTQIISNNNVDTTAGASLSVQAQSLNSSNIVIAWHDAISSDADFEVWDSDGNRIIDEVSAFTSVVDGTVSLASANHNDAICDDSLIVASTNLGILSGQTKSYFHNGTVWDGICKCEYIGQDNWNPPCGCPFKLNTEMKAGSTLTLNTPEIALMENINITGFTDALVTNSCKVILKNGARLGD